LSEDTIYLRIGKITGTHGLKGSVRVAVTTDVDSRFTPGNRVFVDKDGIRREMIVESFSIHKGRLALVTFEGVASIEAAELFAGSEIYISKEVAESSRGDLSDDEFFYFDIIGASAYNNGALFGSVEDIIEGGSGHILVLKDADGRECLLPFVDEMVDTSRVQEKRIDISPPEGLFDQ
jgi:16S rRNA processing protein RimM